MSHSEKLFLTKSLEDNQYFFSDEIIDKLFSYLTLLQEWNQVMNLTGITHFDDQVKLHILDSLSIMPYVQGTRIIDVGTGAGLPGVPLALLFPEKNFTLLDSRNKKMKFVTHVVNELKIHNITVVCERAEKFHPPFFFDSIVSRALSTLSTFFTLTQHLISEQGVFLAMKGLYPENEIKAIPPAFKIIAVHPLKIKGLDVARCLVVAQSRDSKQALMETLFS